MGLPRPPYLPSPAWYHWYHRVHPSIKRLMELGFSLVEDVGDGVVVEGVVALLTLGEFEGLEVRWGRSGSLPRAHRCSWGSGTWCCRCPPSPGRCRWCRGPSPPEGWSRNVARGDGVFVERHVPGELEGHVHLPADADVGAEVGFGRRVIARHGNVFRRRRRAVEVRVPEGQGAAGERHE